MWVAEQPRPIPGQLECTERNSPHSPDCNLAANHAYAGTCLLQWLTTSKNPCLRAIKSFPLPLLWNTQSASRNGCREHRTRLPQERVNGDWGIGGNDNRVRGASGKHFRRICVLANTIFPSSAIGARSKRLGANIEYLPRRPIQYLLLIAMP
jgi:hypothetical protein